MPIWNNLEDDEEIKVTCDCGEDGMFLMFDEELDCGNGPWLYIYFAESIKRNATFRKRLRTAWRMLIGKQVIADEIIMRPEHIKMMIDWLQKHLEMPNIAISDNNDIHAMPPEYKNMATGATECGMGWDIDCGDKLANKPVTCKDCIAKTGAIE